MIKNIVKFVLVLGLIGSVIASMWYYRPWSEYSPAEIATLQEPDKLIANMRNMESLIPWRSVSRGDVQREFSEAPAALDLEYSFQGETKSLAQFIEESTTTGLIVVKDNTILYEDYFLGGSKGSLFTSWSVAKSFVATVIAMAQKEGKINSFEDTVETYAPQFSGSDYGSSRIIDLLAMSSGIDFVEEYIAEDSDVRPFFFNSFILGKNPDNLLRPFKRSRAPLSDFHYISSNSHVLSAVLRAVYAKPLHQIMSEKIWQPLGMEANASWLQHRDDEQGKALGYCCLNARLRDYARFGLFYVDAANGKGIGVDLLPEDWVKNLSKPVTDAHKPGGENYQGRGYSYHFWLPPQQQEGQFLAAGIYGQFIWIDPKRNLVIARTSADAVWTPRFPESSAVFQAISAYYDSEIDDATKIDDTEFEGAVLEGAEPEGI